MPNQDRLKMKHNRITNPNYFSKKISFVNYTSVPIIVATRDGISFTAQEEAVMGKNYFAIIAEFEFGKSARDQILKSLSRVSDDGLASMIRLRDEFNKQCNEPVAGRYLLTIEYQITLATLKKYNGEIYVQDADVVVSMKSKVADYLVHPSCPEYRTSEALNDISDTIAKEPDIHRVSFKFVDNANEYGRMYVRFGEQIVPIDCVQDKNLEDGVYISYSRDEVLFLSYHDNLVKYGIYFTKAEATLFGDDVIKDQHKEKLAKTEMELKELAHRIKLEQTNAEAELLSVKAKYEEEMLAIDRKHQEELRKLKIEEEHRKLNDYSRKQAVSDYYESRSHVRKDSTEWLKAIPTILVGIGSIFLAIKSFKS